MLVIALAAAALAAAQTGAGSEAEPRFDMDITVETASLAEEPLDRTTASTSVLTGAELRASGATLLVEALRRVAGVDVTRAGTEGRVATVRLDGATAGQTLVLVDGVEVNSPTLGLADLSDLTLDGVERVEVVRGPMSALYGSSAMGGVIHVITRRGSGAPSGSVEASYGSFDRVRAAARATGAAGGVSWSAAASRTSLDGRRFASPSGLVDNDAYRNTTLAGGVSAPLGAGLRASLDGRFTDASRGIAVELFGSRFVDRNDTQDDRTGVVSLRIDGDAGRPVRPWARVGHVAARQRLDDPRDPSETGPFASDYDARTRTGLTEASAGVDLTAGAAALVTLGAEWERRAGENRDSFGGLNFDRSLATRSAFAQGRLETGPLLADTDRLVVTAGARLDDVDSFGSTVSPKLGALWSGASGRIRLRAAAGRGFRAPSLNELYFPFFGAPDLEPEVSRTVEVGVGSRALDGRLDVEARLFRSRYEDLIVNDPDTFLAVNLARAEVRGAELEARLAPLAGLWIRGSVTFQDAEDRDTGEDLVRRPRRKGAVSIAWQRADRFRLALDVLATGAARDVRIAGFSDVNPGWTRVDVAGAWTLPPAGRRLELFGRVENLLDEGYSEVVGLEAPGIHGHLGLRARF